LSRAGLDRGFDEFTGRQQGGRAARGTLIASAYSCIRGDINVQEPLVFLVIPPSRHRDIIRNGWFAHFLRIKLYDRGGDNGHYGFHLYIYMSLLYHKAIFIHRYRKIIVLSGNWDAVGLTGCAQACSIAEPANVGKYEYAPAVPRGASRDKGRQNDVHVSCQTEPF